jgi:hypothetical protein
MLGVTTPPAVGVAVGALLLAEPAVVALGVTPELDGTRTIRRSVKGLASR